jgi:hypothetical protein
MQKELLDLSVATVQVCSDDSKHHTVLHRLMPHGVSMYLQSSKHRVIESLYKHHTQQKTASPATYTHSATVGEWCGGAMITHCLCACWCVLQLLGFKLGVFHVELKATSRGPRLIEVNARMGGGGVR